MQNSFNDFSVPVLSHVVLKFMWVKNFALSETVMILFGKFTMNVIIMIRKETPKEAIIDFLK
jgi:hypothetical protein